MSRCCRTWWSLRSMKPLVKSTRKCNPRSAECWVGWVFPGSKLPAGHGLAFPRDLRSPFMVQNNIGHTLHFIVAWLFFVTLRSLSQMGCKLGVTTSCRGPVHHWLTLRRKMFFIHTATIVY